MKLDRLIQEVRDQEDALAKQLRATAERHAADHDVYHIGHAQARACAQRVERLAGPAHRYGVDELTPPATSSARIVEDVRHAAAELLGRAKPSGLLLVADRRELYLTAQATELAWVMLSQSAQAARDAALLTAAAAGVEGTTVCAKWLRTRIKEAAPLAYVAG